MQSLLRAITTTGSAARSIATPEHLDWIESELRASLSLFSVDLSTSFTQISTGPGLYYFDITFPSSSETDFAGFIERWGKRGGKALQKGTARVYTRRAQQHIEKVRAGQAVPFYIGKSSDVRSRVTQHLTGAADSGTYGLKLLSRAEILRGCQLRVGAVSLNVSADEYFCIQFLEAAMRERLHPIVGRQ